MIDQDLLIKQAFFGGLAGKALNWRLQRIMGSPSMWTAMTRAMRDMKRLPQLLAWKQTLPAFKLDLGRAANMASSQAGGAGFPEVATESYI